MTNRDMVKPAAGPEAQRRPGETLDQTPNDTPLPPMLADEDGRTPTTDEEPIDSPQPNRDITRKPPRKGEIGLSTKR